MKPENPSSQNLPGNRVIRRRIADRTTGIHVSALPQELGSLAPLAGGDLYLAKHQIPSEIRIPNPDGAPQILSRNEAWKLADHHGEQLEWGLLSGTTGKVVAFFSSHAREFYAHFGRPSLDFSAFFRDDVARQPVTHCCHVLTHQPTSTSVTASQGVQLGPLFIALDIASALGLTALGHFARGASMKDATVVADVVSAGAYEGTSAYASAKLGVLTGVKAMVAAVALPVPGASLGAFAAGILAGVLAAVVAKRVINEAKDAAVDAVYDKKDGTPDLAPTSSSA